MHGQITTNPYKDSGVLGFVTAIGRPRRPIFVTVQASGIRKATEADRLIQISPKELAEVREKMGQRPDFRSRLTVALQELGYPSC